MLYLIVKSHGIYAEDDRDARKLPGGRIAGDSYYKERHASVTDTVPISTS